MKMVSNLYWFFKKLYDKYLLKKDGCKSCAINEETEEYIVSDFIENPYNPMDDGFWKDQI